MNPLDPNSYNSTQKAGLATGLVLLVLLIVLHNPFSGYQSYGYFVAAFLEKSSVNPAHFFFGSVKVFLGFAFLIIVSTSIFVWLFQSKKE